MKSEEKILCVLKKIKDKSELNQRPEGGQWTLDISQKIWRSWCRECELEELYELEGVLKVLRGKGLVLGSKILHDYI